MNLKRVSKKTAEGEETGIATVEAAKHEWFPGLGAAWLGISKQPQVSINFEHALQESHKKFIAELHSDHKKSSEKFISEGKKKHITHY